MTSITIRKGGQLPSSDGDINEYISPEAAAKSWFETQRRVIFVNGMANSPDNHKSSAIALSLLQGRPVIGVYNLASGFMGDIWQCLSDKMKMVRVQSGNFDEWSARVEAEYQEARNKRPDLDKEGFLGEALAGNKATLALYKLFLNLGPALKTTPIFCHSQGNLITSNALTALALARGAAAISGVKVNSFGSPCRYWPRGIAHTQRAFTFDPVTWLDLRAGFQFDKIGFVAGHGFDLYLKHDAEFTVNRFRWGSFGLTASMDETGLATYLVKMGNNPERLTKILERLHKRHNSDVDDVVEIYARTMRTTHPTVLAAIARSSKKPIQLMIKAMEEGVTFPGERKEIDYLKTLL